MTRSCGGVKGGAAHPVVLDNIGHRIAAKFLQFLLDTTNEGALLPGLHVLLIQVFIVNDRLPAVAVVHQIHHL